MLTKRKIIFFKNFKNWFIKNRENIEAVFFDIDGTLIAGKRALPGAITVIDFFNTEHFPYLLLTNDGNHSVEEKSKMISSAGLSIPTSNFISCSMALETYVKKYKCHGQKFFVMGDLGKPCYAEKVSLKVERNTKKIFECNGVIVGEGTYDWQSAFFAVLNFFIKNENAPLIVPNPDSYWPNGPNGEIGIGAGAKARFICMLLREYGIKKKPIYLGKPYKLIYEFAFQKLLNLYPENKKFRKNRILMLGDSLRSDIKGGIGFGCRTALLLTGITNEKQLKSIPENIKPELVFKSLA
ncbi:MAG TPA: HAD-IIA family hydrolase [Victivallales bacterium]|nr:HAD-IIA family hydrolase [Victivallales bacterium]HPO90053.1 HAD-IIA family hydrolase [Victivallales bacterium]HRR28126.1 HAD-IIA family hydrolase [Victivallales bacterium]HRU01429.1 HAD-IIA family hydrolase [Victivallales bacterium]